MSKLNSKDVLLIGALSAGFYFIYRAIVEAANVKDKLADVGSAVGSGLFDFFHPDQVGETIFYIPTFPDGTKHAVPSRSVNGNGQFVLTQFYGSQRWQLLTNKKNGKRYAAKV